MSGVFHFVAIAYIFLPSESIECPHSKISREWMGSEQLILFPSGVHSGKVCSRSSDVQAGKVRANCISKKMPVRVVWLVDW